MVISLVFSIILPGFYTVNLMSEKALIDRSEASIERRLNLFLRKQIYQSDCIYLQDGQVYLRDLEPRSNPGKERCYNRYAMKNDTLMRYKYEKTYEGGKVKRLVSIGLGSTSQLEKGLNAFSIRLVDETHLLVSYQLGGTEYELFIEHGKEVSQL